MMLEIILAIALMGMVTASVANFNAMNFNAMNRFRIAQTVTQDFPSANAAIQKIIGRAQDIKTFATPQDAIDNNSSNLVSSNGAAVRITFANNNVSVLYFDDTTKDLIVEHVSPLSGSFSVGASLDSCTFGVVDEANSDIGGLLLIRMTKFNKQVDFYAERF